MVKKQISNITPPLYMAQLGEEIYATNYGQHKVSVINIINDSNERNITTAYGHFDFDFGGYMAAYEHTTGKRHQQQKIYVASEGPESSTVFVISQVS